MWIRKPRSRSTKSWDNMTDLVVPLERNLNGYPLAGLLWDRKLADVLLKEGCESARIGMLIYASEKCFFFQVTWMM